MKAVIPAAGLGSRFLPATKAQPKEMLPVLDKPAIQYIVEEALEAGVDEVIIVNSRDKKSIEDQFSPHDALVGHLRGVGKDAYADAVEYAGALPVSFVYQDEPLGLGHAVHVAAPETGDDMFFVMLGDVLVPENGICQKMREVSEAHDNASVIAVLPVSDDEVSRFGIIGGEDLGDGVWKVTEMIEKPALEDAPSNLASFGRYLLTPRVMELLATTEPGAGGEIQLTDALVSLLDHEDMYALVIDPRDGYDTGTVPSWIAANVAQAMKDPKIAAYLKETVGSLFA
ncbi:MAG: nucleotidyltransferase [Coriobacteriia bacterium]|nr:MAG: nucleotidyltransferase [Coriobacteriia bacterium]